LSVPTDRLSSILIGAMVVAWSQLGDKDTSNLSQLSDNFLHGS
jgi:hypothetical protein